MVVVGVVVVVVVGVVVVVVVEVVVVVTKGTGGAEQEAGPVRVQGVAITAVPAFTQRNPAAQFAKAAIFTTPLASQGMYCVRLKQANCVAVLHRLHPCARIFGNASTKIINKIFPFIFTFSLINFQKPTDDSRKCKTPFKPNFYQQP